MKNLIIISSILLLGLNGFGQEPQAKLVLNLEIDNVYIRIDSSELQVEMNSNNESEILFSKASDTLIVQQFSDSINLVFKYRNKVFWTELFSYKQFLTLSGFSIKVEKKIFKKVYHVSEHIKGHGIGRYWEVKKK